MHPARPSRDVRRQGRYRAARRAARVLPCGPVLRRDGPRVVARDATRSHRRRRPLRLGGVRRRRRIDTRPRVVRRCNRCVRIPRVRGRARRHSCVGTLGTLRLGRRPAMARALRRVHQRQLRLRRQGNRRDRRRRVPLLRREDAGGVHRQHGTCVPGVQHHVRHVPKRRVCCGDGGRVRGCFVEGVDASGLRERARKRGRHARVLHADAVLARAVAERVG